MLWLPNEHDRVMSVLFLERSTSSAWSRYRSHAQIPSTCLFPWGRTIPSSVGRFPVTLNKLRRCCPELLAKTDRTSFVGTFLLETLWSVFELWLPLCLIMSSLDRVNVDQMQSRKELLKLKNEHLECIKVALINFRMVPWWYVVTPCHPKRWLELSANHWSATKQGLNDDSVGGMDQTPVNIKT